MVGSIKAGISLITGTDPITGEAVSRWSSALNVGIAMIPGAAVASGVAKLTSHAALAAGMTGMTRFAAAEAGTLTKLAVKEAEGVAAKGGTTGTEIVQRWMSQAELQATQSTGLLRGGRDGVHYVTDAANTVAQRVRQRLALPQTPEVRVTLEVPNGIFSAPTRVETRFNMPGGGMERTATGEIFVKILGVD